MHVVADGTAPLDNRRPEVARHRRHRRLVLTAFNRGVLVSGAAAHGGGAVGQRGSTGRIDDADVDEEVPPSAPVAMAVEVGIQMAT